MRYFMILFVIVLICLCEMKAPNKEGPLHLDNTFSVFRMPISPSASPWKRVSNMQWLLLRRRVPGEELKKSI